MKCQSGRTLRDGPTYRVECAERPAPNSIYCAAHLYAALDRVMKVKSADRRPLAEGLKQ